MVATGALAVLIVTAVSVHLAIGSFRDYPHGVSLLQEDLVQVASSTRNMRIQSLSHSAAQSAGTKGELEPEAIRFENDNKAGGGDLMVPVSMVDYENLGEGSIVDQRYPRRYLKMHARFLYSQNMGAEQRYQACERLNQSHALPPFLHLSLPPSLLLSLWVFVQRAVRTPLRH